MTDLRYYLPNGHGDVLIAPRVLAHFQKHMQKRLWHREAGGQLFAVITPGQFAIVEATGPRRSDKRSIFGFEPDRRMERAEIKLRYERGLHFVGDWHTHRQRAPEPSGTDIESMRDMVERSDHGLPGFLLIIVGTKSIPQGLHVSFHSSSRFYRLNAGAEASAPIETESTFRGW